MHGFIGSIQTNKIISKIKKKLETTKKDCGQIKIPQNRGNLENKKKENTNERNW